MANLTSVEVQYGDIVFVVEGYYGHMTKLSRDDGPDESAGFDEYTIMIGDTDVTEVLLGSVVDEVVGRAEAWLCEHDGE